MFLMKSREKQKTITRTLRISGDLDNLLEKDSKDKRISTNSLISSILTKYAEWDRYTEKVGFISLPRDGFKLIISSMDEQEIRKVAEEVGSRQPPRTLNVLVQEYDSRCFFGWIFVIL